MSKKMLWKDIKKCFSKSKGRFVSIACLIALGSFALVGLQVAGPDMRITGTHYFNRLHLADLSILGDYGIDAANQQAINQITGAEAIEYGYLKDVVIQDTITSIRIFSNSKTLSTYEVVEGRLPQGDGEIAMASTYRGEYKLGDSIAFTEMEDAAGEKALKRHEFQIVGFVNSGEMLSGVNLGQSTAGTGELRGYAVVDASAFDYDVYMIARISFADTRGVDPYSSQYTALVQNHKNELDQLLAQQPDLRLSAIRAQYQEKIDEGQTELDEAKQALSDAEEALGSGAATLTDAKQSYADGLAEYQQQKANANRQLSDARKALDSAAQKLSDGKTTLAGGQRDYQAGQEKLAATRKTLDDGWTSYHTNAAALAAGKTELAAAAETLEGKRGEYNAGAAAAESAMHQTMAEIAAALPAMKAQLDAANAPPAARAQYDQLAALVAAGDALAQGAQEYQEKEAQLAQGEAQLSAARQALERGEAEYAAGSTQLSSAGAQVAAAEAEWSAANRAYQAGLREYAEKAAEVEAKLADANARLESAAKQISDGEQDLSEGRQAYDEKKPEADKKIADAEAALSDARKALDTLKRPVYALDTRRELPGSEGYRVYSTVSETIDALADIFPIFLYLVAALVTLTTMTRFVDEERVNSGTLKALGYRDSDIVKKFSVYGGAASLLGAVIGIGAGHTLLPLIVYETYGSSFTLPRIELRFYPGITIIALLLAAASAIAPAYLVAAKELQAKPSALLQPKPPKAGSKIFLERIRPLWNRLSFTHKVTARNLFRYKGRMFMTIFGVCGSVTLLFAGFSVQHSISGINDRQFNSIIQYDLIVAKNDSPNEEQEKNIEKALSADEIKRQLPVHYEELTRVAGNNQDKQSIKLLVTEDSHALQDYISFNDRSSGTPLALSDQGVILSERLATLLHAKKGTVITVTDSEDHERELVVADITEMYIGHFIFMNGAYYRTVFGERYHANANLVTLNDRSLENANVQASKFVSLSGVKGVVQNTTLINQINTIVDSLNLVMQILIIVAIMLAVVILYNLTNINVSERIRELSTIKVLGFYNKEVTLYIYRETILLTLLGILAGFGFGDALYLYILSVVPPDEVMFNPVLGATAFLVPLFVVCAITAVLGALINRRLKNVDMLESLKSVE